MSENLTSNNTDNNEFNLNTEEIDYEELISRLEITIEDFNKEVDELMGSLKKSSEEKEKLMQQIKNGELPTIDKSSSQDSLSQISESPEELSEWEKRLEGIN